MDYRLKEKLTAIEVLVGGAERDRNITERRSRMSQLARACKRLMLEVKLVHPITHKPQRRKSGSELFAAALEKGWVDISNEPGIQFLLAALDSKSALRRWPHGTDYSGRQKYRAAAPKWAVVVCRYAPSRLKEVWAYKEAKRKAITFQLEAQHVAKTP